VGHILDSVPATGKLWNFEQKAGGTAGMRSTRVLIDDRCPLSAEIEGSSVYKGTKVLAFVFFVVFPLLVIG
jgi:hypothetical protein